MASRFDLLPTPLAELTVLQRKPDHDGRGYFERMFCSDELREILAGRAIAQVNHTRTTHRGTVRGLHFQKPPHAETKFISCLRGEVYDVAVDIRPHSPTFLRWHAERLSADNHKTLIVPEGFAHGFQALQDDCEMLYFHTAAHHPDVESGWHVEDPRLAIPWPLPIRGLSPRDALLPFLDKGAAGSPP